MTLTAFSQISSLLATLNEHIRISPHAEMCAVAVSVKNAPVTDMMSGLSLCDDCHHQTGGQPATPGKMKAQQQQERAKQQIVLHEDEDGYCELVEVTGRDRRRRSSSINKPPPSTLTPMEEGSVEGDDRNGATGEEHSAIDCVVEEANASATTAEDSVTLEEEQQQQTPQGLLMGGGDSYYTSAMKLKEQLLSSTQTVPLSLIAANLLALNQTITKLLVS